MPELDRKADFARNDVAAVGGHQQLSDRAAPIFPARPHHPVHQIDDPRGADQGVFACRRRSGAGVAVLTDRHRVVPDLALRASDDADALFLTLQDRSLFDMQFEIRIRLERSRRFRSAIADAVQGGLHCHALGIRQAVSLIQTEHAGPDAGAHQAVAEATAFLIGPVDQLNGGLGDDAQIVQAAHHLQPGDHAQRAIEFSAGRLAVQMAAEQHRRSGWIAAGAASKHVADRVHPHRQTKRLTFRAEPVPAAFVHVGQGQPPDAALRGGADFGEAHQRVPEALAVDALIGLGGGICLGHGRHLAQRAASCKPAFYDPDHAQYRS